MQLRTKASEFNAEVFPSPWPAAGMSYLVHTPLNRFIVIDGGFEEDAPHLIETMKNLSGEETPRVALWILTHSDGDHYRALEGISKNEELRSSLIVEEMCFQLPETGLLPKSGLSFANDLHNIQGIVERLAVPVLTPHTDMLLDVDGVGLRFFSTPEDYYEKLTNPNELSLVFQIIGPNRKVMMTGDAYDINVTAPTYRYWDELKSDICQLAHHGLNGANAGFYQKVNASIVLIPISESGDRHIKALKAGYVPRLYAERLADRSIKAYEGDVTLLI